MQVFLGGAYAGKRAAVRARLAHPIWHTAYQGARLNEWPRRLETGHTLVLEGWECWLAELLARQPDDDRLRQILVGHLDALIAAEGRKAGQVALTLLEMGCGVVPMDPGQRRLRDQMGWLAQAAVARAEQTHQVWHGLVRSLPVADGGDKPTQRLD